MRFFNRLLRFGPSDDDNVTQTFEPPLRELDITLSNTPEDEDESVTSKPVGILVGTLRLVEDECMNRTIESVVALWDLLMAS